MQTEILSPFFLADGCRRGRDGQAFQVSGQMVPAPPSMIQRLRQICARHRKGTVPFDSKGTRRLRVVLYTVGKWSLSLKAKRSPESSLCSSRGLVRTFKHIYYLQNSQVCRLLNYTRNLCNIVLYAPQHFKDIDLSANRSHHGVIQLNLRMQSSNQARLCRRDRVSDDTIPANLIIVMQQFSLLLR